MPELIELNPLRSLRKGDMAPYLDMANMPTSGHTPNEVIARPFGSGMRYINGDTLVARITPCLENGKTAYVDFLKDGQTGWGSTDVPSYAPEIATSMRDLPTCLRAATVFVISRYKT